MTDAAPETPTVQQFVNQGWADHERDAPGVLARLPEGVALVREAAELPALAALTAHVAGEHLGRWSDGLRVLDQLAALECFDAAADPGRAVLRSQAALHLAAGDEAAFEDRLARGLAPDLPEASSRGRVLAVVASALAGQRRLPEALARFRAALELASYGPDAKDPLARALAVTGNNLACELEERADRGAEEDELLELAATTARTYWEIAGDWNNVQIAEYRLAMSLLALGRAEAARAHAAACLELCVANQAGPGDLLFAHEVTARVHHARGDGEAATAARDQARAALAEVEGGLRDYAEQTLAKLDALLQG